MKKDYNYIRFIPKPLLKDFIYNRVVPFVGAGFSKNADIPDGISMSDWNELGKKVASELPDYQFEGNAIDAFSYYETLYSRSKLVELLMRELHISEIKPGETIDAFCNLFSGTICTTNWDSDFPHQNAVGRVEIQGECGKKKGLIGLEEGLIALRQARNEIFSQ